MIILNVFSQQKGKHIIGVFREIGQAVTVFQGEGMKGSVFDCIWLAADEI